MDMGLGLKPPPPKMEILALGHKNDIIHGYGVGVVTPPPKHENIPKLEFSLGLGHKNDIIHGYGVKVEKTPPKT